MLVLSILGAHAATPSKPDVKGRRLTGEECARMERLIPETANYLGMRGNAWQLIEEGRKGIFPEANEAMVRWVNEYNHESQLRYGYQMGDKFFSECKSGKVRAQSLEATPKPGEQKPNQEMIENSPIAKLARERNCLACHAKDKKIVGPAFKDVAKRYANQPDALQKLTNKILIGGTGAWGEIPMLPNNVTRDEAAKLATWVLQTK